MAKKISSETSLMPENSASAFPIVGIGASAGGLEAFMELFQALPPDTGMAFVLIQHLSPQHFSMLSEIIQKSTRMPVEEITEGTAVTKNQVYVIPPNKVLEISQGILHLTPIPEPHSSTMPVNTFLSSLAHDQGNLGIGIILSGTGSDGAHGLRDIKADGGITFVQDPKTAKFDGMPRSAIAEAAPDYVMTVKEISLEIVKIARHPISTQRVIVAETIVSGETEQLLQRIFILIRSATKIDFSTYKFPTIIRRIKRRMVLHRIETLAHYLKYLQETPTEINALFEDLLINVTDFFRDAEAFETLKSKVFPALLQNRPQGTTIRIWVPGCSTGEEVYSIAISLLEYLGDSVNKFPIQIYGTDICESAVKVARQGIYPESSSTKLSTARIERFFQKDQDGFRISKAVRDCCIFSIQDVTNQPPINRLDLLSCRNLMIYLGAPVQKKLMETFYFALNPTGFLMLGSSESVGTASDLFSIVDKKNKIYSKKGSSSIQKRDFHDVIPQMNSDTTNKTTFPGLIKSTLKQLDPVVEAERIVLDRYAPAWVLVDQLLDIVQFRGETGNYIEHASGHPTWNLMRMLRGGLSPDVRVLIHAALKDNSPIRKSGLKIQIAGVEHLICIEVAPVASTHCLVIFIKQDNDHSGDHTSFKLNSETDPLDPKSREIFALKDELSLTRKSLQTIIEDQNASNEEMQSANEEVLSANEELQSTNEELETAKEELQSTNEELTSLNDELTSRNHELDHLNNDLINVLHNANVSIVMVDTNLRIKRFTPMAEKLLKLIKADIGRNLMDINLGFQVEEFENKIVDVIKNMESIELETTNRDGQWYSIRIRPYKTTDNRIDGAVIVLINIDEAKNREKMAQEIQTYSEGIIQTVRDPLIVLDQKLRVERVNQAFYDTFNLKMEKVIGHLFYEMDDGHWDSPELRNLLEEVLPKQQEVRNFKVAKKISRLGNKSILLNARALQWEGQIKLLILISLHDVSEKERES